MRLHVEIYCVQDQFIRGVEEAVVQIEANMRINILCIDHIFIVFNFAVAVDEFVMSDFLADSGGVCRESRLDVYPDGTASRCRRLAG